MVRIEILPSLLAELDFTTIPDMHPQENFDRLGIPD